MRKSLLSYLICPKCKQDSLQLQNVKYENDEIKSGLIHCTKCSQHYEISNFIPSFIPPDQTQNRWRTAWSYKWNRVAGRARYTPDGDQDFEIKLNYTGLFNQDLSGKLILDAGCGSGQDMARVAKKGATLIGVDQSEGVYRAREYNKQTNFYENLHFVRADIFDLPFKEKLFDIIYSNGALHHTQDTAKAFGRLPSLLKKDGVIAIWVYDRTQYWRLFETFWRPILCRLPRPFLASFLHLINRPWYWIYRYRKFFMEKVNPWPQKTIARHVFDIISFGHFLYLITDYHLHLAVTIDDHFIRYHHAFDCYSPYYAWGHDESELFHWFNNSGITVTSISGRRCGMTGIKS